MITIVYTLALYSVDINMTSATLKEYVYLEFPSMFLTIVFLLDLIANFIVLGATKVWEKRRILYMEIFLQVSYWLIYILCRWVIIDKSYIGRFSIIDAIF